MKNLFLLFFCWSYVLITYAQNSITSDQNSFRHGDRLYKLKIGFVPEGERGKEVVWKFDAQDADGEDFNQYVISSVDTIAVIEEDRIIHYVVSNDTLFLKGKQSRRGYEILDDMRPQMHFPCYYQDSIYGTFSGMGLDEKTEYSIVDGFGFSCVDGLGKLTDGEDTISNISRIHLQDNYTKVVDNNFIVNYREDRYMWYATGYRYPVMETFKKFVRKSDGSYSPVDSMAYLYLPSFQLDLAYDQSNSDVLAEMAEKEKEIYKTIKSIEASLSNNHNEISISLEVCNSAMIGFQACDIVGNIIGQMPLKKIEEGQFQINIHLDSKPIGNIVLLKIINGDSSTMLKVSNSN